MRPLLVALLLLLCGPVAAAVTPQEILKDQALETRARALGRELRCLVCQNQSIDDSDAELAQDLRRLVRERLVAGDSDAQVLSFVTARYGDFVLLAPPFRPSTWLLWLGPFVLVLLGGGLIAGFLRRRRPAEEPAPLDATEARELERLLERDA
jgi:cytochrome c-type biogenesis protein CcmH